MSRRRPRPPTARRCSSSGVLSPWLHSPYCVARAVGGLEAGSVEQPDRQAADEDDPQKDEDESDVRLPFRIIAREEAHKTELWRRRIPHGEDWAAGEIGQAVHVRECRPAQNV